MKPLLQPYDLLLILILLGALQIPATHATYNGQTAHHRRGLPKKSPWQSDIHALFQVGAEEKLVYPPIDVAGPKPRQAWLDAYARAKRAGLIPAIPPTNVVDGNPVYPSWYKGNPCSYAIHRCNGTEDINYPPAGIAAVSFDDGPQPPSRPLLAFLKKNSQQATHFLVGSRIVSNPAVFAELDNSGQHMAGHTWAHPLITALTDEGILGELGWVMQIIYDKTGKRKLPNFWRPPYGDIDDRVRAIGRHVFGLTAVTWSHDPRDWCLADTVEGSACGVGVGPQSSAELHALLYNFALQPMSKGLMILHHEGATRALQGYMYIFPIIKQLGWDIKAIPEFTGRQWYH